jgi:hypothetical protein
MIGRASEITALCESWVAAATAEGGIAIGSATEQYRLRNNGIYFHELDYGSIQTACLGLSRVLLHGGLNTVIDWDHRWFWAWCGEIFAGRTGMEGGAYFGGAEGEIRQLFGLACRAALAGVFNSNDPDAWERQREQRQHAEPNAQALIDESQVVLVYLSFPLLEAISKKACGTYVDADGRVIAPFSVPGRSYRVGARCSSVRDLLWLLHDDVASDNLRSALDLQRQHLQGLDSSVDSFGLVYDWRNSSLHGSAHLPTIGGTVFNTAILIALDGVAAHYGDLRDAALGQIAHSRSAQALGVSHDPFSFYPPYWPQDPAGRTS